ncbi:MAG: MerR family transcriptional regulator [Christensenella sp.]|nr:MerR family transcriptional regulator [Christensenella sp.]
MFTIGEFSKICMVTTKTLRHYDSIGLLRPSRTDTQTGYRYYEASQLRDLLFILKCKDYGFTLEQTSSLLHADPHTVAARFAAQYETCRADLCRRQSILVRLKNDIEVSKKGNDIMDIGNNGFTVIETKPMEIISVRDTIAIRDFDKLYGKVLRTLAEKGLRCEGVVCIYHCREFDPEHTDIEIGAIIPAKTPDSQTLAGGTYAMAAHFGPYDTLGETYASLVKWIEDNGYHITGEFYEKYLNSPHEVPAKDLVTEIYFPIAK